MGWENGLSNSTDTGNDTLSLLAKGFLYFHTLKYLKASQIFGRIWFKLKHIKPDTRPAPKLRPQKENWQVVVPKPVSMLAVNRFCFLNHINTINLPKTWQTGNALLWMYNLHYFDDLNAIDADKRQSWHEEIIRRWVAENPAGHGVGWEPYPQSLRIVNWVKWHLSGNKLSADAVKSLAIQVRYLTQQMEWHIRGNHLLANAKALIFAGVFYTGDEADEWLSKGMNILSDQISEQILDDGGHFERSPMYHAIVFEDLLDLLNLFEINQVVFGNYQEFFWNLRHILEKMYFWLDVMCHPDGEVSFFNDAAFGIAALPSDLFRYADRLGIGSDRNMNDITYLDHSGYIRVNKGNAVLLIDAAPIGPDFLPGHAHADTLSFELSLNGKRVIVNSGTSQYAIGPHRDWERSTAAHNTVEVDGQNSSEIWAGFRVARRAYPNSISIREKDDKIIIEASHNGYRWLDSHPVHSRIWKLDTHSLIVMDNVKGRFIKAKARFYFHPEVLVNIDGVSGTLKGQSVEASFLTKSIKVDLVPSSWFPRFGVMQEAQCLILDGKYDTESRISGSNIKFSLDYS